MLRWRGYVICEFFLVSLGMKYGENWREKVRITFRTARLVLGVRIWGGGKGRGRVESFVLPGLAFHFPIAEVVLGGERGKDFGSGNLVFISYLFSVNFFFCWEGRG